MSLEKQPSCDKLIYDEKYDFSKISDIINALDYLRIESRKSNNEDIEMIINSCFNLCFNSYYSILSNRIDGEVKNNSVN